MKTKALICCTLLAAVLLYIYRIEVITAAVDYIFETDLGTFKTDGETIKLRYSDQETATFYSIKDSRFGNQWIDFAFSSHPDRLKCIMLNGHYAVVSESNTNAVLYYCTSLNSVYPFSEVGVPGVTRPILPNGYVYENDVRNPYDAATFCGQAGCITISHHLRYVLRELYDGKGNVKAGIGQDEATEPPTPKP